MTDNHQLFLGHLEKSKSAVWVAARFLSNFGYGVTVNPTSKANTHSEWKDHVDDGDIKISLRVEVKGLSANFTCAEDWPFGEKFIVCAKHAWDMAAPKPYLFIYLNSNMTHAAFVIGDSSKSWTVESRVDRRYSGVKQDFYFCPIDLIAFSEI